MPLNLSMPGVELLIGADPELFGWDKRLNQFVSSHDLLPGTKHKPFDVKDGAVQVDGVSFEYNILPAASLKEFMTRNRSVIATMQNIVKAHNPNVELRAVPTATFPEVYFDALPQPAKELGCTPDFNAWSGEINQPPFTIEPFRTGSGHIHVGWTKGRKPEDDAHIFDCQQAARQLDSVLFIPSLLWDLDAKRRSLYGKMGAFRPKTYGVEYRVLSNAWLSNPKLTSWVYLATKFAMEELDKGNEIFSQKFCRVSLDMASEACESEDAELSKAFKLTYYKHLVNSFGCPNLPAEFTTREE